jgi:hypothetical protein
LSHLRTIPEYWIINSEVYLNILSKEQKYYDEKFINKDLIAIYNYIHNNNFMILKNDGTMEQTTLIESEVNNYLGDNFNLETFINDGDYLKFVELVENESYMDIDITRKTIFDVTLIPHIYRYFTQNKYKVKISELQKGCNFSLEERHLRIQNFIMYFSLVEYTLPAFTNPRTERRQVNGQIKKYGLRKNKFNEEELEQQYLDNQIKILNLNERINSIKNSKIIQDFFSYLRENKVIKL